ncbi:MAG: hypothetical protein Q4D07_02735 [Selenomonadaceae bacterium]|nr:hypothetical protein [Selenomonadaceae bacterium]
MDNEISNDSQERLEELQELFNVLEDYTDVTDLDEIHWGELSEKERHEEYIYRCYLDKIGKLSVYLEEYKSDLYKKKGITVAAKAKKSLKKFRSNESARDRAAREEAARKKAERREAEREEIHRVYLNEEWKKRRIEELLEEVHETFSQYLLRLIDQKGFKDSDVYNRANISRQLFSKIRNDKDYQPTKKTVMALTVAMRLNIDEACDLMARGGYTFNPVKKEELIVYFFIENEIYDIFMVNDALEHFGLPILF